MDKSVGAIVAVFNPTESKLLPAQMVIGNLTYCRSSTIDGGLDRGNLPLTARAISPSIRKIPNLVGVSVLLLHWHSEISDKGTLKKLHDEPSPLQQSIIATGQFWHS